MTGINNPLLAKVDEIVGQRQDSYDSPDKNFARIAALWSVILEHPITAQQVALCMIALKMTRLMHSYQEDSVVDIMGYAVCLDQVQQAEIKQRLDAIKANATISITYENVVPTEFDPKCWDWDEVHGKMAGT